MGKEQLYVVYTDDEVYAHGVSRKELKSILSASIEEGNDANELHVALEQDFKIVVSDVVATLNGVDL